MSARESVRMPRAVPWRVVASYLAAIGVGAAACSAGASHEDPPAGTAAPTPPSSSKRPASNPRSGFVARQIPFEAPTSSITASAEDIEPVRALGRSDQEARRTAAALAMCDAWLRRHLPGDSDARIDRQPFFARMAHVRKAGAGTWSIEATAAMVASATNESLARQPLTKAQLAVRDEQRRRVCETVLATITLIEQASGATGFAAASSSVERDVRQGIDKLFGTSWACVGQVPISSGPFEELISSIETAQARSVLAAATKLKPPIAREEMPDIAASAVSTVLVDALFDYARAAFVDGFAGRGVPLPFYGFSGGISGRFSNIRIMPSGELPRWELADPSQSASTAPDKAPTAAPSDLQPAPKQSP